MSQDFRQVLMDTAGMLAETVIMHSSHLWHLYYDIAAMEMKRVSAVTSVAAGSFADVRYKGDMH